MSQAAYTQVADEFIRIGSWNIQNLGDRDWGQHPKALAQHIQLAAVDIIALQEIYDTDNDDTKRTNGKLNEVFDLINQQEGQDWVYKLFPKRDLTDIVRHCGIAWNRNKLTMVGEEFRIPVEYTSIQTWKRQPYAVKFTAGTNKTDFVVISVHMKSNRKVAGQPSPILLRKSEAKTLVEKLEQVKENFEDEDIIIIGDMNCFDTEEDAIEEYLEAGFEDLNAENSPTYKNLRAAFDRILVPKSQLEFKYSKQYILTPSNSVSHFNRLSDHFLILTAFRILSDDDPID
jgi:predicted extracellular nuclease